jgi:hypothetical protein
MKKFNHYLMVLACVVIFMSCEGPDNTGSVFTDHTGVPFDDGSGLPDVYDGKSFFFGNLHSHTEYSDGEGTPAEAFTWARDMAGYDFYAITDHAEMINSTEWDDTGIQASNFTRDGIFVAIRGFEWSGSVGHINVWRTDSYTSALSDTSLSDFYDWLDAHNGYSQFNHPGRESSMFYDFSYEQDVTDNMLTIETGNKGSGNVNGEYLQHYAAALERGWRLAPTNNQDNHSLSTNSHRTVIIADQLSQDSLFTALSARRVYSSDDPNMEVLFKVGAHWMGEVVNIAPGSYEFIIRIYDDEPLTRLEIIDSSNTVAASLDTDQTSVEWNPVLSVTSDNYYYLKVYENDINGEEASYNQQITVTAPIWLNVQ